MEVAENFPEECRYVLETLGGIWHHDALAREQKLSSEERLRLHQEHSGPLMKTLHEWMEAQLAERKTEPNSGLGKAILRGRGRGEPRQRFAVVPGHPLRRSARWDPVRQSQKPARRYWRLPVAERST